MLLLLVGRRSTAHCGPCDRHIYECGDGKILRLSRLAALDVFLIEVVELAPPSERRVTPNFSCLNGNLMVPKLHALHLPCNFQSL
jgi:hypothetical protein